MACVRQRIVSAAENIISTSTPKTKTRFKDSNQLVHPAAIWESDTNVPAAVERLPSGRDTPFEFLHNNTQIRAEMQTLLLSTVVPPLHVLRCKHWTIWMFISRDGPLKSALSLLSTHVHSAQNAAIFTRSCNSGHSLYLDNRYAAAAVSLFKCFLLLFFILFWKPASFIAIVHFVSLFSLFCCFLYIWATTAFCCSLLYCLHDNKAALDLDVESIWPDKSWRKYSSEPLTERTGMDKAINTHYI